MKLTIVAILSLCVLVCAARAFIECDAGRKMNAYLWLAGESALCFVIMALASKIKPPTQ